MYPDWQFLYWFRSVFWKKDDFVYRDERTGAEVKPGQGKALIWLATASVLGGGVFLGQDWIRRELPIRLREFDTKTFLRSLTA